MGILNDRLNTWIETHKVMVEYQSSFSKGYSTADNIYNLSAIVNIKLAEKKKVDAFFVDFKAAFDSITKKSPIYKLYNIGIPYKCVKII